jgi:type II secretory ATPase GspE/PulE/Tfp pilus assembly ATPase PilB-like protein
MSQPSDFSQSSQNDAVRSHTHWSPSNFEPAFGLIDSLISKESCTYHQILPLSLVEKCLTVGMVNLKNTAALDYVRSLVSDRDYALKIQPIDSKTLQLILSAYSNSPQSSQTPQTDKSLTGIGEQPTLLVDRPEQLMLGWTDEQANSPSSENNDSPQDNPSKIPKIPTDFNEQPTLLVDRPEQLMTGLGETDGDSSSLPNVKQPSQSISSQAAHSTSLPLEAQSYSASESVEFFVDLSPQKLWQELLSRVVSEGIGRLYFERQPDRGRIFWSKNGVLQLSLEKIAPSVFQGAIDEFKRFVQLSSTPVQQAKKGELERVYRQERLLLRWQIIPGKYGEEGTLQVLRGKASQLYQQRQIDELGTQAIRMAESLERKIRQIQSLSRVSPTSTETVASLRRVVEKIERHLDSLDKS